MTAVVPAPPSERRLNVQYAVMQAGYWAMYAAFCAYQTALLLSRGFSSGQAGVILAIRCMAGILCQPILGGFADRHPKVPLKLIVDLSLVLSLAANVVFYLAPPGFWGTAAVFAVVGGFELSAYPLMDSMAIQFINAGANIRYSLGRGIGSLCYACTCVLLGLQVGRWGVGSVLVTHASLIVLEMVLIAVYPTFRADLAPKQAAGPSHSVWWLLRSNPRFTLTLCAVLLALTAAMPPSNFLINIIADRGGESSSLGTALFLTGAFELPAAFLFQRLRRKLNSARLLSFAFAFIGVKALALFFAPGMGTVFASQAFQMLGYGLFIPTSVYFVNDSVPAADRVRGQTLMMVASNGLGGVCGNLLGGFAAGNFGVDAMLLCCVALSAAAAVLAAAAGRLRGMEPVHQ